MELGDREFEKMASLVYDRFGIHLPPQKKGMMAARLNKILMKLGMESFNDYYEFILKDTTGQAASDLINAISTNHTFFFRESAHFDLFTERLLPEFTARLSKEMTHDLRIWSAGCSSGEEPYTLVMLMMEYFGREYSLWDAGILATDISERVLDMAQSGIYSADRVTGLPAQYKFKYFKKASADEFEIDEKVRKQVTFRRFNLMNTQFPFKKQFHIIFCRNVMIYFDRETREALVERFYQSLVPGGYFFIGHSESLGRQHSRFEYVQPAVYRKP